VRRFRGALRVDCRAITTCATDGAPCRAVNTANSNYTEGSVVLWDTATRKPTASLDDPHGHGSGNPHVLSGNPDVFTKDGTILAVADSNGNVYLWNLSTSTLSATLHGPAGEAIGGVAFGPDGGIVTATASNTKATKTAICIWNAARTLAATSTTRAARAHTGSSSAQTAAS
jgi:WD40 repeat protein